MEIGKVIRRYRKEQNLTQEEMATRLGVTAPAVNKWENGNSMPDITLLGPIARLLHISVNELLSYREDLTEEEINQYDSFIADWYKRALESKDERIRYGAADSLYAFYMHKEDFEEAAKVSEFGRYHENAYGLELLVQKKDVDGTIAWMENVLGSVETIWNFIKSPLYEHMTFKPVKPEFAKEIIVNLKNTMKDEETYGYLAGNERWEKLIKE